MVLEDNSIKREFIAINTLDFAKRSRAGDNSLIISAANSYELSYDTKEYLFKADTKFGQKFVEALYDYLPDNYHYIYISYTNTFNATKPSRMLQDIWAFETRDDVDAYIDEINETQRYARHSHVKQLPDHVDFDQPDWIDEFEDLDYFADLLEDAKLQLQYMNQKQRERSLKPPARKLPDEFILGKLSDPATLSIGLKATEYNKDVDEYLAKLREGLYSEKDREHIEKMLDHRYKNFYHHLELNSLTSNLLK